MAPIKAIRLWCALLGLFVLTGCGVAPPAANVSAGETKVPAVTLSYCWHEWYQAVCSDSIPLTEILQRHGIAATLVPAGELIRISWPNQPRAIKVVDHRTDNLLVESDGKIMAPTTPGVYAYELWTEWGQGTAWYGFLIQVP